MNNSFVVKIEDEIKVVEVKDVNELVLVNYDLAYRDKPEIVTIQELMDRKPIVLHTESKPNNFYIGKRFQLKQPLCNFPQGTVVTVKDIRGDRCVLEGTLSGGTFCWHIPKVAMDIVLDLEYKPSYKFGKLKEDFYKLKQGEVVKITEHFFDNTMYILTSFEGVTQVCVKELLEDRLELI